MSGERKKEEPSVKPTTQLFGISANPVTLQLSRRRKTNPQGFATSVKINAHEFETNNPHQTCLGRRGTQVHPNQSLDLPRIGGLRSGNVLRVLWVAPFAERVGKVIGFNG